MGNDPNNTVRQLKAKAVYEPEPSPETTRLEPRFVILKANNGHAEALGPVIELFTSLVLAQEAAEQKRKQFEKETFEVYERCSRHSSKTVGVIEIP